MRNLWAVSQGRGEVRSVWGCKVRAKRVIEDWVDRQGKHVKVEWNACGCHPDQVTVTWGRGFYQAATYVGQNKSVFTKRYIKKGMTRVKREIRP